MRASRQRSLQGFWIGFATTVQARID